MVGAWVVYMVYQIYKGVYLEFAFSPDSIELLNIAHPLRAESVHMRFIRHEPVIHMVLVN